MPKKERCSGKVRVHDKIRRSAANLRTVGSLFFAYFPALSTNVSTTARILLCSSGESFSIFSARRLQRLLYPRSMTSRNRSSDAHPRQFITIAFEKSLCRTIDAHYRFVIDKCVISCYTDNQLRFSESNPNTGDIIQWTLSGDVLRSALSLPFSVHFFHSAHPYSRRSVFRTNPKRRTKSLFH